MPEYVARFTLGQINKASNCKYMQKRIEFGMYVCTCTQLVASADIKLWNNLMN